MTNAVLCILLTVLAAGYALLRGSAPERWAILILSLAMLATSIVVGAWPTRYHSVELGVLIVDLTTAYSLAVLAARANRFWPIGVTGLQLVGISGHCLMIAGASLSPGLYARLIAYGIYPQLGLIAWGVRNHRVRVRRWGTDRSWVISSQRSASHLKLA